MKKRHLYQTRISIYLFVVLCAGLSSCGRVSPDAAIDAFVAGDLSAAAAAAQKWSDAKPSEPAPHFILSMCAYLNDDVTVFETERVAALGESETSAGLAEWLATLTPTEPRLAVLLPAIAAQLRDDKDTAAQIYRDAIDATEDAELKKFFQFNLASIPGQGGASARIFGDEPLTYKGAMTLADQTWVPMDDTFEITGGVMRSAVTKVYPKQEGLDGFNEVRATFGGWAPAKRSSDGKTFGWAALLTGGEIYMTRESIDEDDEGNTEFRTFDDLAALAATEKDRWYTKFDVSYDTHAVDYFGRFTRITLGEGQAYPVFIIEKYKHPTGTFLQIALGTEFAVRPKHFTGSSGGMTFFGGGAMVNQVSNGRVTGPVHRLTRF